MSTSTWPSLTELERIAAAEHPGRDFARERRETAEAMRVCDELEALDKERAADHVEELLVLWTDEWGYPLPGFESSRFVDARKGAYHDWLMSEAGERTRRNVHPAVQDRLDRGEWDNYAPTATAGRPDAPREREPRRSARDRDRGRHPRLA